MTSNQNYRPNGQRPAPRPAQAGYRPQAQRPQPTRPASARPQAQRPAPARPQANRQRPVGAVRTDPFYRTELPAWFTRLVLIGILALLVGFLLQLFFPDGFKMSPRKEKVQELSGSSAIALSEVMTSNTGTIVDGEGKTRDWIEVVNNASSTMDLTGWSLARNQSGDAVYTFGSVTLDPGERLLVFCSGLDDENNAPFRLSSQGDTLMLFNASGTAVDSVNIPALESGTSYARDSEGAWFVSYRPTPGDENTAEGYARLNSVQIENFPVRINEVLPSNKLAVRAADGGTYDYVELYNTTGTSFDLTGCYLSDSMTGKYAWRFPDGTSIGPGEYMIVFCSGLDTVDADGYCHTCFRLASGGEEVVLTNASGQPADHVKYGAMSSNRSWALENGVWKVALPTPGKPNQ